MKSAKNRRPPVYISSIPVGAEERIVEQYPDGEKRQAEYWLNGERVGLRYFFPTGEPEVEYGFRDGIKDGMVYVWSDPGHLCSAEPFVDGVPHGTAWQWGSYTGRVIGTYTLERGTGIDLWRQEWNDGSATLSEVHSMRAGRPHGVEWWLDSSDQQSVHEERHWFEGELHGIERDWNLKGRLRRGFPRYWVRGRQVTKRQYLRAAARDATLPPFRSEDNDPQRTFPPEIAKHLGHTTDS
jgi:antitoxin component YwqK of YwqJK toxin-antitoxin module